MRNISPKNRYFSIGEDIFLSYFEENPRETKILGKTYYRFLDRIYIPMETHLLSERQIAVINRYREANIYDEQFAYNRNIKTYLRSFIKSKDTCLEFGPSKYPLKEAPRQCDFLCEIDAIDREYLRLSGYNVLHPDELSNIADSSMSFIVACFVFQFDVTTQQACEIKRIISSDGILLFNVPTKSANTRVHAANELSQLGFRFAVIDLMPIFNKNDAIFIGSIGESRRADEIEKAIRLKVYSND